MIIEQRDELSVQLPRSVSDPILDEIELSKSRRRQPAPVAVIVEAVASNTLESSPELVGERAFLERIERGQEGNGTRLVAIPRVIAKALAEPLATLPRKIGRRTARRPRAPRYELLPVALECPWMRRRGRGS
jgi:hypothetical protein